MKIRFHDASILNPLILATIFIPAAYAVEPGTWPIDQLQSETPRYHIEDTEAPIQSILYTGEPANNKATEVFAFYASPATLGTAMDGETFPGIVLIHGGGGTAFSDWVWMWANRGYAAIAMDLAGSRPPAPAYNANGGKVQDFHHKREKRARLEKGGLDHGREQKFESIGGTVEDDWPYHAVANVIKAHSLMRSFDGVDPERTAVTGISWGGYTTCLAASLDERFKAAVPVYGCGFLHEGESIQKPAIDALGSRREAWVRAYDPGSHLGKCKTPIFWVNGTNDKHYVLDSYAKSYALVQGAKTFRIEPMMRHSHGAGWEPIEIGIFVDSILKNGTPLPEVGPLTTEGGIISANVSAKLPITKAQLHFTTGAGLRADRIWKHLPARVEDSRVIATGLPAEANTWLLTITDERDAMVTSEVGFR